MVRPPLDHGTMWSMWMSDSSGFWQSAQRPEYFFIIFARSEGEIPWLKMGPFSHWTTAAPRVFGRGREAITASRSASLAGRATSETSSS